MPTFVELLKALRLFGLTLKGTRRYGYGIALLSVISMHKLMNSSLASSKAAYRKERWDNVQVQLNKLGDYITWAEIELPQTLTTALNHYCTCKAPEDY